MSKRKETKLLVENWRKFINEETEQRPSLEDYIKFGLLVKDEDNDIDILPYKKFERLVKNENLHVEAKQLIEDIIEKRIELYNDISEKHLKKYKNLLDYVDYVESDFIELLNLSKEIFVDKDLIRYHDKSKFEEAEEIFHKELNDKLNNEERRELQARLSDYNHIGNIKNEILTHKWLSISRSSEYDVQESLSLLERFLHSLITKYSPLFKK